MTIFNISPDSPKIYSEEFTVRSYDTDIHRRLTIQKLCSFLQEIAGNHTVACGVGWEVMNKENIFWVLSRLKINIVEFPKWQDKITIKTWSNGLDGLHAIRNFQVLSSSGETLIKAVSAWLLVNSNTRRLMRADDFMRNFPICNETLFDNDFEKIKAINEGTNFKSSRVTYNEIDMNSHVNNVSYIDRLINSFDFDFLKNHQISYFEINFLKESVYGDILQVQQQKLSKLEYLNNIIKTDNNAELVRTKIEFRCH